MELSIATGTATAVEAQTVESVLPDHFETDAPELIKLLKAYYRHLNKELAPSYELNNLIRQHDVDRASEKYLDAIERMIASVIPKSRSLDRVRLFKIIANYYNSRGSEESIYAFFRIFYNELITLVYPKEYLFTVADLEKGTTSTKNRIRDSFRWQEFSYVVNSQSDQADWRNEFIKFIHPAGLKFFVALTLELIQDNDWIKEALEYYLNVTKVVKLTSELPTGENAPDNGTLYIVTDANDGDNPITKFDNVPRVFKYSTETSPEAWTEVESVLSFADWIDWDTFFGKHTPQDQYLDLSLAYLFKVLMGDGGYHYLTHTRLISDKKGTPAVDRDSLKAFFNKFILLRLASNDNTIQTAYREDWTGETKFIDNAAWGEYGNATIAEAGAAYTKYSDGAFKYPSAFEVIDESEVPYLDFIESDLVVEDFNEPIDSPITYVPAALSSSEYTEGWMSFIIDTADSSPQGVNHELIRILTSTTEAYVRIYEPDLEAPSGYGIEIANSDLFQIGDVFVNGVLALDRDGNNYFSDGPLISGLEWTNVLPLLGGGVKHILMRYKWKLPADAITAESGIDPRFRALYDFSAFSRVNLNIERFRKVVPDIINRINGVVKYSDTPSEYKVSYNTHFNNFSAGSSIDFYTRSFLDSLSIDEFDFIIDPPDPEYNNGAIIDVTGDGSDFFKREVTTNGVRIMGAGDVGGQTAVPDAWLEKVARMFELFTDPNGAGINETFQRALIKNLSGDTGTYHAGFPTIQRVARGAGDDYSTNFLTDAGAIFWNLTDLYDTHVQNDMVWYLNSTGDGYGDGDIDAQEVIEHVFHTLHMHGLPAEDIKLYPYISSDWQSGDLYAAMEEAYDAGKWDPSGYQVNPDDWKTDGDAFEVAAKEYLYLLNFCMFEYTELWDGGSLSPEWTDDMRTQAGILANNPLGYAFHNTHIAPVISKIPLATIRSIFQDGNTPAQDNPALAGASGYVVTQLASEHFVFTGITEVNSDSSPQDDVIDVLHTFESDDSDLYFQFSEAQRTWALYTSDSSPEGEQLFINRTPWTTYPFIPEITDVDYTQWETVASYDDSTPLFGSSYPLAAITSDDRFINILYKRGWDNNSPAYESPSQIFLSSTETIDEDDSPHYTHDTQTSFQNSFVFTQD